MQRTLIICLSALLILSSCKLIEDTTESEGGNVTSTIKVTAPNGGESLMEGSSFEIKWTGTTSSLLKIHYTVDNGSSWTLIADSLKNLGIYNWFPIPNI